jgi:penicillin-binding protein 1A
MGRDDNSPMRGVTGGLAPAEFWKGFMRLALKHTPVTPIPPGPPAPVAPPPAVLAPPADLEPAIPTNNAAPTIQDGPI